MSQLRSKNIPVYTAFEKRSADALLSDPSSGKDSSGEAPMFFIDVGFFCIINHTFFVRMF